MTFRSSGLSGESAVFRHLRWLGSRAILLGAVASLQAGTESPPLSMIFTGQVLIEHVLRGTAAERFSPVAALLQGHDAVFTDLETAIASEKSNRTRDSQFFHAAGPEVLDFLKNAGFNLLALSNNHSFDLGAEGIVSTGQAAALRGFTIAGTGATLAAAAAPAILTTRHGRVALVAFASGKIAEGGAATGDHPGVNEVRLDTTTGEIDSSDAARVFAALRAAAKSADFVIAYQHDHYWEKDNRLTPKWKQSFARACIEAGATAFVSHGAPLLQGIEFYRGRPIFYDLGGLIFHTKTAPGYYLPEVWEGVLVEAEFAAGHYVAIRLRAIALNERGAGEPPTPLFYETRGAPTLASVPQARTIFDRLRKLSSIYGTRITQDGDAALIELPAAF